MVKSLFPGPAARDVDTDSLEKRLFALCKNHLAPYKIPRDIIILKELPLTTTGKVNKKELRAQYAQK